MKILYDYQAFNMQKYGGVSNSFVKLIENLPSDIEPVIGVRYTENYHLLNSSIDFKNTWIVQPSYYPIPNLKGYDFLGRNFPFFFHTPNGMSRHESERLIKKGNYDIFHATFFDSYFLEHNKSPYVITIHDMTPEVYNFDKRQIEGKKALVGDAAHIIAVSEYTKNDIIRYLGVSSEKITVIYHGFEPRPINSSIPSLVNYPYILYVGARWLYKSFDYFVAQVSSFLLQHEEYKVICTGSKFNEEEKGLLERYNVSDKFVQKFCTEEELNQLYAHAFAFVYPSKYEGFGMPILEAFHAGCPVILNNKSCFPEIAQDAALYFDSDTEDNTLLKQLEHLYSMNPEEKNELHNRAVSRLKDFSWMKSAEKLAEVYHKILNNS